MTVKRQPRRQKSSTRSARHEVHAGTRIEHHDGVWALAGEGLEDDAAVFALGLVARDVEVVEALDVEALEPVGLHAALKAEHRDEGALAGGVGKRQAPAVVAFARLAVHGIAALREGLRDQVGEPALAHGHVALERKVELVEDVRDVEGAAADGRAAVVALNVGARTRHLLNVDHHVDEGRADDEDALLRLERMEDGADASHAGAPSEVKGRAGAGDFGRHGAKVERVCRLEEGRARFG